MRLTQMGFDFRDDQSHSVFVASATNGSIAMLIGYARTSTIEQVAGFEAQQASLKAHGCDKLFAERVSSVARREQLELALDYAREGDTLVVTKLDRLARSVANLVDITRRLEAEGVALRVLDMSMDTGTPQGRLMLNMLGSIAQFERELMLERQREGIAKAKADGKYHGRAPTARRQLDSIVKLRTDGEKPEAIAAALGISRASVFRVLRSAK
jgi:DNA invertase Pin-like site-specific DNA recombinase